MILFKRHLLLHFLLISTLIFLWECKKDAANVQTEKLIFRSDRTGRFDIYMMNTDGSNLKDLTNLPNTNEYEATLSPEARRLLFTIDTAKKQTIYILKTYSSLPEKLIESNGDNYDPIWSPDGSKFAFISTRDLNKEIYISLSTNANPSVKRLTNSPESDESVSWSPDGLKIAFISNRDGNKEVYEMNADGSETRNLTNNLSDDTDPSWSPDGKKIMFVSNREQFKGIYVIDPDSLLSPAKLIFGSAGSDAYSPKWSPDGKSIAFVCTKDGNEEIYTINADKTSLNRLTKLEGSDHGPRWSPDGQKLVFITQNGVYSEIAVVRRTGGVITKFASNNCIDEEAEWVSIDNNIW